MSKPFITYTVQIKELKNEKILQNSLPNILTAVEPSQAQRWSNTVISCSIYLTYGNILLKIILMIKDWMMIYNG